MSRSRIHWAPVLVGALGYFVDIYDLVLVQTLRQSENEYAATIKEVLRSTLHKLLIVSGCFWLVCALILQLLVSWLQTQESEFLDTCNDICHKNVAGKLRLNAN